MKNDITKVESVRHVHGIVDCKQRAVFLAGGGFHAGNGDSEREFADADMLFETAKDLAKDLLNHTTRAQYPESFPLF
jgi:hypothetical protein